MRAVALWVVVAASVAFSAPARADDLDALAKAIDERPDDRATYDAFAQAALKQKRYELAIRRLEQAVARLPDYAEGYYKLAYAHRQRKEWSAAADNYRRYLAADPGRADTYYGLGAALEGLGDKPGAIAAYEKYVALEKSPEKRAFVASAETELAKLKTHVEVVPEDTPNAKKLNSRIRVVDSEPARGEPEAPPPPRKHKASRPQEARADLERELARDAVLPPSDDDLRLIDPFEHTPLRDLKDPFHGESDLVDPFRGAGPATTTSERLRQYEAALAAYRRALARHAEDVSLKFERGVASALSSSTSAAMRAWNAVPLEDAELTAARKAVERIRGTLLNSQR